MLDAASPFTARNTLFSALWLHQKNPFNLHFLTEGTSVQIKLEGTKQTIRSDTVLPTGPVLYRYSETASLMRKSLLGAFLVVILLVTSSWNEWPDAPRPHPLEFGGLPLQLRLNRRKRGCRRPPSSTTKSFNQVHFENVDLVPEESLSKYQLIYHIALSTTPLSSCLDSMQSERRHIFDCACSHRKLDYA